MLNEFIDFAVDCGRAFLFVTPPPAFLRDIRPCARRRSKAVFGSTPRAENVKTCLAKPAPLCYPPASQPLRRSNDSAARRGCSRSTPIRRCRGSSRPGRRTAFPGSRSRSCFPATCRRRRAPSNDSCSPSAAGFRTCMRSACSRSRASGDVRPAPGAPS